LSTKPASKNKLYQGRSWGGYSGREPASTDDLTYDSVYV
jgi:hypothetical protein